MPYPFAHPAAILPLGWLLGRHAVWSALIIGSLVPDLWYVLPAVHRFHSHSLEGVFLFCLPAGLAAYVVFHMVKLPALELLPGGLARRLWGCTSPGLPSLPWLDVAAALLVGAITHLVWDEVAHVEEYGRLVRHGSTLAGGALVLCFAWRALRRAPDRPLPRTLSPLSTRLVLAALGAVALLAAAWSALEVLPLVPFDYEATRLLARTAGIDGIAALLWAFVAYGLARRLAHRGIMAA